MSKYIFAMALFIVGLVGGVGFGYYLTPQYQETMYTKSMDLGTADRLVDLRYVNAMIAHHRGAILLAEQVAQSSRQDIRSLATAIQADEPKLIAELYAWKKAWYSDTRGVRDPARIQLGSMDEKQDLRFLNTLIAHHEAGIAMTREIRAKSSRTEVLNNADAVEQFLQTTLVTLKDWRQTWYSVN